MLEALFSRHKIILFVFVILVGFFAWHSKDFEINASADTLICLLYTSDAADE